jgi:apolipoprotein N-acyltransferase
MVDHQATRWRWLGAAATGAALNLVQGVDPWWPAIWFAPIPLLLAALSTSVRETFRLALVASLLGLISTAWYVLQGGGPVLETAVATAVFSFPQGLPLVATVTIWRIVVGEGRRWYAPLTFPLVAAAVDLVFSSVSWHGTWGSWANSQMDVLPVVQTAALGGTPAMVFVVTLSAATAGIAIARKNTIAIPLLAYGLPLMLVTAALGYGLIRLADAPGMSHVAVGLAAADDINMQPADAGGTADLTLAAYLDAASLLRAKGSEIVVLPEKIEILNEATAARARATLSAWARQHQTNLLIGFAIVRSDYRENRAWLFDNDGNLRIDYSKQHLVPLVEMRFRPGERDAVVMLDRNRLGVAICKDMDFPRLARRYGRAGIQAMLVPAWDFDVDGIHHARMAVLRGVEQGFSVIRAANMGMLTISDPYGRIVAEAESAEAPVMTLSAQAPLGGIRTLYGRIGDAFGWSSVAIVGLLMFWPAEWSTRTRNCERRNRKPRTEHEHEP